MKTKSLFGIGLTAALLTASVGQAGPFTAGNIVVTQIYDGTATIADGNSASVILVELNIVTGAVVQTIALPTAVVGANHALTIRGSSTSSAHMSRSVDKRFLTLTGFDSAANVALISQTPASSVGRTVAFIDFNGVVDTSTVLTDAYDSQGSNSDGRQAVSTNGTDVWVSGTGFPLLSSGVRYAVKGATTSLQVTDTPTNCRCLRIFNNQLYVSTMSGAFQGLNAVGTGVPNTSGNTSTHLNGFPIVAGPSFYDFFFADANTVYITNDAILTSGGGIMKWTFDSGTSTWISAYTLSSGLTNGCRGLVGQVTRAGTTLWATTADTVPLVVKVTDTGAASAFTTFATSPAPTGGTQPRYRGIDFVPEAGVTPPTCYPNCDHSTVNPCLNVQDFSCFLNSFANNETYANCDHSTINPVLNVQDFSCFLNAFANGCSSC